jgi:hypothetical protein
MGRIMSMLLVLGFCCAGWVPVHARLLANSTDVSRSRATYREYAIQLPDPRNPPQPPDLGHLDPRHPGQNAPGAGGLGPGPMVVPPGCNLPAIPTPAEIAKEVNQQL